MNDKTVISETILEFSNADSLSRFNFSSGHIGYLPISEKNILSFILSPNRLNRCGLYVKFLVEFIYLLFNFLFPIKNIAILTRSVLRRYYSKTEKLEKNFTVISLGEKDKLEDPYFGKIFQHCNLDVNYLKVIGGYGVKMDSFYIESCLEFRDFIRLFANLFIFPVTMVAYLVWRSKSISTPENKMLFVFFGLKEINSGKLYANNIYHQAIIKHLNGGVVRKLLYPMEGRAWERMLAKQCKIKCIYSIGYFHCALTPRNLALTQSGMFKKYELPNIVVTPGEMIGNVFSEVIENTTVRNGYFLRSFVKSDVLKNKPSYLLFALTSNIDDCCLILDAVSSSELYLIYDVRIKLNKNERSYDFLYNYAVKLNLNLYDEKSNELPRLCFFRSSSVAIEYMSFGVTPVYIGLDEVFTNNIFELDDKSKYYNLDIYKPLGVQVLEILRLSESGDGISSQSSNYYLNNGYNEKQLCDFINSL